VRSYINYNGGLLDESIVGDVELENDMISRDEKYITLLLLLLLLLLNRIQDIVTEQ
jgi:hypothetical protein